MGHHLPPMEPSEVRAFVAIKVLGLCSALEAEALDAETAARWMFRPGMIEQLRMVGACQGCLGLVELGEHATTHGVTPADIARLRAVALKILTLLSQD